MGKVINKTYLIYLLMYLIFFTGYRHQLEKGNILLYALIFIISIAALLLIYQALEKKPLVIPVHAGAYGVFILAYITSVIHSINLQESIYELILIGIAAALFFITINIINVTWKTKEIIDGLLIIGLIYIADKFYQMIARAYALWPLELCQRSVLIGASNKTAGIIVILIIFALSILLGSKTKKEKIIPAHLITGSIIVLFFTGSRGGYVALAAGVAVVLLIDLLYGNGFIKPGIKIPLAAALVAFPILATSIMRPLGCPHVWTTNIITRFDLWAAALKIFAEYPLLGAGPGTYKILAGPLFNYRFIHPHSAYLMILAERGIVGIITAAILLLTIVKTLLIDNNYIGLKAAGLASLAACLVHGIADVPLLEPYTMRFLVMILALAVAIPQDQREVNNAENN